jgi:PAS domain S-box-containing protein
MTGWGGAAREFLAAIVDSSEDAIFGKSLDCVITSWNAGAERLYGYTAEEAVGRPVSMLTPPERAGEPEAIAARVAAGERIGHFETVRVRKDGERVDVSLTVSPIRSEDGAVIGASTIARDVTARKRDERRIAALVEELERSNERFQIAASAISAMIYEYDLATGEVTRSKGVFDVVGYASEEVPTTASWWRDRIHPEDLGRVDDAFAAATDQAATFAAEYRVRHRNDTYVHVYDQGVIVRDERGAAVRVVGSAQNVTERKRAEEERDRLFVREQHARREAEEASRIKDEFLATISHELRTPLNAILGWARMLGAGGLDEPTSRRGIEALQRNALSLTELVNDLLDVSRIISGGLRLDVRAVEPATVVESAVDAVRPSAEAKGIELHCHLDPATGPVLGDPERLQQVAWNLLSNAIKFTDKGGRVQVLLERVGSYVELTVSDTGNGIAEAFLPYVFDRFRQADSSITRSYGGLGLGLSIVRHLVELHGGAVHAASDGVGRGSTFSVRLPVMVVRSVARDPRRIRPDAGDASGEIAEVRALDGVRVLVVDDEPDTREILSIILGQCAAEVETAESAEAALRALDTRTFDVLISDIGMPGADGLSLIRSVRAGADGNARVPAVALTAYARVEDRARVLSAGFQAHVGKPVEPAELVAVVAGLVGRTGL